MEEKNNSGSVRSLQVIYEQLRQMEASDAPDIEKIELWKELGDCYGEQRRVDVAITYYEKVVKCDPSRMEDVKMLARILYEEKKDTQRAIQLLHLCTRQSLYRKKPYLCQYRRVWCKNRSGRGNVCRRRLHDL